MKSERGMTDDKTASKSYDRFIGGGSKVYYLADAQYFEKLRVHVGNTHTLLYCVDDIFITETPYDFTDVAKVTTDLYAYQFSADHSLE